MDARENAGRVFLSGFRRQTKTETLTQENTNGAMHLSVNSEGLVSLWDSEQQARSVRGEQYVHLVLSVAQQTSILLAASLLRNRS